MTEIELDLKDKPIRKIEDIIDIQKANGNIRQVAFKLPSETNSNVSFNLAKSLETVLSKVKLEQTKKKAKRRQKYQKQTSDVISWPSDSDITVLRMKLCTKESEKIGNVVLGDGLHQPDSSSMVNLATLILQSQSPSKHSLNVEEYLLPLTSWEHARGSTVCAQAKRTPIVEPAATSSNNYEVKDSRSACNQKDDLSLQNSDSNTDITIKSKVARFLRLYFCPCCTCLYELEKIQEKKSTCLTSY